MAGGWGLANGKSLDLLCLLLPTHVSINLKIAGRLLNHSVAAKLLLYLYKWFEFFGTYYYLCLSSESSRHMYLCMCVKHMCVSEKLDDIFVSTSSRSVRRHLPHDRAHFHTIRDGCGDVADQGWYDLVCKKGGPPCSQVSQAYHIIIRCAKSASKVTCSLKSSRAFGEAPVSKCSIKQRVEKRSILSRILLVLDFLARYLQCRLLDWCFFCYNEIPHLGALQKTNARERVRLCASNGDSFGR